VSLEVNAPDGPVVAPVDADLLALALANLAANAVRALGDSGGTLRLTVAPNEGGPDARQVVISLEDDGPGIPPDLLDALFEPYVSGRAGENVGLGLAMVRQIAAEHGGRVEGRNREEGGACFRLILPRAETAAAAGEDER
jgi:two-component system C4-dicarboxylate transport sensor histidine kinase DctB